MVFFYTKINFGLKMFFRKLVPENVNVQSISFHHHSHWLLNTPGYFDISVQVTSTSAIQFNRKKNHFNL